MTRNLKAFALAFFGVLAMGVVAASMAQADPVFTCSSYPCKATGSNTAGAETITTPGGTVQCDSHFLVEKYGTAGESIASPASTVTVTPSYLANANCVAFGFINATVTMNECDYEFHGTERTGIGRYNHHMVIHCPDSGNTIRIAAGTCEVAIGTQTLTTVETENNPDGTVTVAWNLSNITINVIKDGFGCPFAGTGHKLASYHGEMVLSRVGGGSISTSGV